MVSRIFPCRGKRYTNHWCLQTATTPASKKRTPASGKKGKSKKYVSDDSEPEEPIDLGDTSEEEKPGKEEFEEMEEFGEDDYVATATKEEETEV